MTPKPAIRELVDRYPAIPYVSPFVAFVVLTALQPFVPGGIAVAYPIKTVLVLVAIIGLRRWLTAEGEPHAALALGTGILVLVVWILPEGLYPLLGDATPWNPFQNLSRGGAWVWIAFRLFGTAVIVPVVEEFFWRGFLIRWLIKADFRAVQLGTFTWYSFLVTSGLFAVEHNRWLVGLLAGMLYNLLYYRSRSLKTCIVAHGVTNLGLGIYVLLTGEWTFM